MTNNYQKNKYSHEYDKTISMNIYYIRNKTNINSNTESIINDNQLDIIKAEWNHSYVYKFIKKIVESYIWKFPDAVDELNEYILNKLVSIKQSSVFVRNKDFYLDIRTKFKDISTRYNIEQKLGENTNGGIERGKNRMNSIEKHILKKINHLLEPTSYLDIGCYDGSITKSVSNYFKLNKAQTHGVDISAYTDYTDITFNIYDGKILPYDNASFDMITCLMVLHHIDNIKILISEIHRVMKPNGIIILHEHDVNTQEEGQLLDIMHDFYDYVWNDNKPQWQTNYKSHNEWSKLFYLNGFVDYTPGVINKGEYNPFMKYMCSYRKLTN
jgi:ubiquinone/menaquinone biosynthesis C-methylase UbiE